MLAPNEVNLAPLSISVWGKCTARLHQETHNVSTNEYFGEPSLLDDGVVFSVNQDDDSAEFHVNCGREESRCD